MITIDYLLLHNSDIDSIDSFEILPPKEFSNHAPLYFSFLRNDLVKDADEDINFPQNKISWDNEKVPLFREYVKQSLPNLLSSNDTNCTINEKVELLTTLLAKNSTTVFDKVVQMKTKDTKMAKLKLQNGLIQSAKLQNCKKIFYKSTEFLCEAQK